MKAVILRNEFKEYEITDLNGYTFKPRKKNINNLTIINKSFIKMILSKKINNDIKRASKTIRLMLRSDVTEISDCDMMIDEVIRVTKNLEKKYMRYFSELEYFDVVKNLYFLNMEITAKKKIISEE